MLKIAIVVFRECVEIALFLGIILAVTEKIDKSRIYILLGCVLGIIGSSVMAFFVKLLSNSFYGMGDEIFDSSIILITVVMIGWTIIWMQGYSVTLKKNIHQLSDRIMTGSGSYMMLILTVAVTILREGTEIILYVFGIAHTDKLDSTSYILGLGLGVVSGLIIGVIIYWGLIKFASKYIFNVSSILLMLIGAGFASEAAGILTSTGIITVLSDQLWDSSWLIDDNSGIGKFIHVAIGYNARPNGMQVIFYLTTIITISTLAMINKRSQLLSKNLNK